VNVQRKLSQLYSPRLVSFDYLRISLISTTWWTLNTLWKIILELFDTGPTSRTQYAARCCVFSCNSFAQPS
jgi:hypothetical protein